MKNDLNQPKVPFISKLAYGMGDVGCNFSWMFVGNFLMIFYTDVFGISMSAVATLMLFSRFWDAINDPIIGGLSDKTHTRWGRYRPWLLFAAPLTALVLILTFWAHPDWSQTHKIIYMAVTYCILVLGYTCVNIPYGTLCGAMTQNMTERAQINTSRSVSAMIAIGIINIITIPLIEWLGNGNARQGYLLIAILYGTIFAVCHIFCFAKTKEVVEVPVAQKIPLRLQLQAVAKNKPYLLALLGQVLFGFILYGRNADLLYYFTYVENDAVLFTYYSMAIIIPSIIGAACFPKVFQLTSNKGWAASVFAFGTGITIIALFFFSPVTSPIPFYLFAALSQFFFSGFNTAIYAIIPDCVEYGEWRTGIRNDGFQYAFISLGNKIGMALGTALLALSLGWAGYEANTTQNEAVVAIMRHSFSTIPGILWVVTALALFFYKLDKRSYNRILAVIKYRFLKRKKNQREYDVIALGELLVDFNALHSNDFDSVVYESNPGGAPCNVLAMLSNLQKRTAFIGKVGDDFLGHALQQRIVRMGISTEGLSKDKKRNTTLAFLNDSKTYPHQYLFYRNRTADMNLDEGDVDADMLSRTRIFHFGSLSFTHKRCRKATRKAIKAAKSKHRLISFDPNYRPVLWPGEEEARKWMLYGCSVCDILKVEASELAFITQQTTIQNGVDFLQKHYSISLILVTSGEAGSQAFMGNRKVYQEAFLTNRTIDTTGAGDTFLGCCLAYILEQGMELSDHQLQEMLFRANAAASLETTRKGAIRAMPTQAELEDYLKQLTSF
ncbi:glycoside-pentoside-hexuronide (GPH):cation symporter [Phocaeicola massiliensis]|jgi:probable glucitol transport protein GutA|uniref:glycoside-pentoside-hexuronide (GPH):cation symporter n=1 Tax=Phocaeicola massiliensis TaxID=204516 RepID=UPI00202E65B1|nr:glycoside-pentoside-hexuronide (GPH):cation symporter [Phocaeicola massiliensis]MCM1614794.1 glycoside-pentoside-hexuronide (GPH):cation symporter [Phocaeicola massiliensis]MCM1706811.1 glycoside-pentoside-hexuronide (GPH):cation symporter [Phocaeicola massiliensis]